jgi:hypothetical protein
MTGAPPMMLDCKLDVTGAPVIASSDWLGACVGCGKEIRLPKAPRPCHVPRLKCKSCRKKKINTNTRRWQSRHIKKHRAYYLSKPRKKQRQERFKVKNAESKSRATQWYQKWGVVDDAYLVEHAEKSHTILARELGRTINGVKRRIWRLRKAPNSISVEVSRSSSVLFS